MVVSYSDPSDYYLISPLEIKGGGRFRFWIEGSMVRTLFKCATLVLYFFYASAIFQVNHFACLREFGRDYFYGIFEAWMFRFASFTLSSAFYTQIDDISLSEVNINS